MGEPGWVEVRAALEAVESAESVTAQVTAGRRLRQLAEQLECDLVQQARANGLRWAEIGQLYGTSKQGVQQRFRRRDSATS
ncbi:hypothetical protein GCM10009613_25720 [Pseudonocardia kongjuensis]|uniref:Uncharacterized protein n=1 Tax=Pseudonocardia kongjuensis TaxID=102227 RepID=A0ABN1XSB1_9PSEU